VVTANGKTIRSRQALPRSNVQEGERASSGELSHSETFPDVVFQGLIKARRVTALRRQVFHSLDHFEKGGRVFRSPKRLMGEDSKMKKLAIAEELTRQEKRVEPTGV